MKKNSFLWAALSMTAALVMTACTNDDNANESPAQQNAAKTIPYTVTVNGGEGGASTRAIVANDPSDATNYHKTLYFATGDKLYVTGTNIKGVLEIQTGTDAASATFSGDLIYSGSGTPASELSLTATLVSAQQTVGTEVSVDAAGAVTVNYPSTAYCGGVATAVQKYSNLTGTSTYGTKSFSLTQQTAFLNFVITFEDATTTGTELSAVVSNNSAAICTANVTTTTESEKVVAKFVLPVAKGTTLSSANVKFGDRDAISFGASQTLQGKVYNVTKTQAKTLAEATAGDIGKIAGKDSKIYATKAAAEAVATGNAVAMIAYVGSETGVVGYTHGLALALSDEGQMAWEDAIDACSARNTNTPVTGATWLLANKDQWNKMIDACKNVLGTNNNYQDLRDGFNSVGGSNLVSHYYWANTEYVSSTDKAWVFPFNNGSWNVALKTNGAGPRVRACLAF